MSGGAGDVSANGSANAMGCPPLPVPPADTAVKRRVVFSENPHWGAFLVGRFCSPGRVSGAAPGPGRPEPPRRSARPAEGRNASRRQERQRNASCFQKEKGGDHGGETAAGVGRRGVSAPQPRRRPPPRPPAGAAHCARQHGAGVGVRGLKAVRPSRVPLWWWLGGAVRVLHAWTAEGEGVLQQLSLQLSFTPLLSRGQLQNRFGARRSTDGGTKEMTCRWQ